MRRVLGALLALCLSAQTSLAANLVGLSLQQLIQCAGIPSANMPIGNQTFLQYSNLRDRNGGVVNHFGNFAVVTPFAGETGCEATITVTSGRVTQADVRPTGLITGPIACGRLFGNCP